MRFPINVHFKRSQLAKLHRNFFHPSASKLFNLIKKARREHANKETLRILQDTTKRFDPCQRIKPGPYGFRVSLGTENLRLNERIFMDIMNLGSHPVLHIADEATHFSAASFLTKISTVELWEAFMRCWSSV